jgi:acetyl-CoA carboxylase biotin carboxyl carrier protein
MSDTASAKATDGEIVAEKKDEKKQGTSDASFNMDELEALAALVNEHGFTDFEFENENIRVRLSKMAAPVTHVAAPVAAPAPAPAAPTATADAASETMDPDAGLHKITSPIVGTFYRSPGPDKDAYVSEGSKVSPESTVCIVEAMKLMNEIQAEVSGEIVKIYVENGQPVEFGQALFGVKK